MKNEFIYIGELTLFSCSILILQLELFDCRFEIKPGVTRVHLLKGIILEKYWFFIWSYNKIPLQKKNESLKTTIKKTYRKKFLPWRSLKNHHIKHFELHVLIPHFLKVIRTRQIWCTWPLYKLKTTSFQSNVTNIVQYI